MYLFIYYLFYILIYTGLECFCRHWHWHHHHYQHILCVQWIMNCIVTESRGRVLFIISISWIKYTFGQNILGLMFTPATRSSEYFVTTVTRSCWCWANHGTVILWPKYLNNKCKTNKYPYLRLTSQPRVISFAGLLKSWVKFSVCGLSRFMLNKIKYCMGSSFVSVFQPLAGLLDRATWSTKLGDDKTMKPSSSRAQTSYHATITPFVQILNTKLPGDRILKRRNIFQPSVLSKLFYLKPIYGIEVYCSANITIRINIAMDRGMSA